MISPLYNDTIFASCSPNNIIACLRGGKKYGQVKCLSNSNNTLGLFLICLIDCSKDIVYRFTNNLVTNVLKPNSVRRNPESTLVFRHHCDSASSLDMPCNCWTRAVVISAFLDGDVFTGL